MSAQQPFFSDTDLQLHWSSKYIRSDASLEVWRQDLRDYLDPAAPIKPYNVKSWEELKETQRQLSMRLLQKAALVPDATNRLSGRAFVALVMQLQQSLGNTQEACFYILHDVLEEFNLRPSISTFGSFRVAKSRFLPK